MHAGHFVSRRHKSTKYNELNVNAQCCSCNYYRSGEQYKHGVAIDQKYGRGTAEKLMLIGGIRQKVTVLWYKDMIDLYEKKIADLKEKKLRKKTFERR